MTPTVRDEIQQDRPMRSAEQEAYLNIVRTGVLLNDHLDALLKPHGISLAQYNVLRILRGAEPDGLCRNAVRDRMVTRMPDMTRLLDRMEEAGLVTREQDTRDKRMVRTVITAKARKIVDALDDPVNAEHCRRLGHLSRADLKHLIATLERVRDTQ